MTGPTIFGFKTEEDKDFADNDGLTYSWQFASGTSAGRAGTA